MAKGWESKGFPVTVSYSLAAVWNMAVKLSFDREGPASSLVVDMERGLAEEGL
jgi:hypothetical protein